MRVERVTFANGNRARLVYAEEGTQGEEVLGALGLSVGFPVVLLIGGADSLGPGLARRIGQLLEGAMAEAAGSADAMVVDGGTQSGVMALMGRAASLQGQGRRLIGVSPAGRVSYPDGPQVEGEAAPLDPNHGHFVLAPSDDWGGETETMFELVDAISVGHPVAVLLAGGGGVATEELRVAALRGYPIVVLAATGGLSDRLVEALTAGSTGTGDVPEDLAAIIAPTDIRPFPPEGSPEDLRRMLARELG